MKKVISFLMTIIIAASLILNVSAAGVELSDIKNHWAKDEIQTLINKGAVSGYPDGTFRPENPISSAEFMKILLAAVNIKPGNSSTGHWATKYYNEALNKGYLRNGEIGNLDELINRANAGRMAVRTMTEIYPNNIIDYAQNIKDYDNIPGEFQMYILKAYVTGVITGYEDGTFQYKKNITRAEACVIINRVLDKTKRKVPSFVDKKEDLPKLPEENNVSSNNSEITLLKINLNDDPVFQKFAAIDGFTSASGVQAPLYSFTYGEVNPYNNNKNDKVLSVDYIKGDSLSIVASFYVDKYDTKNMERFKKAVDLAMPDYKDELYSLALKYMGGKTEKYFGDLGTKYEVYIRPYNNSIYPTEQQGAYIAVIKKK